MTQAALAVALGVSRKAINEREGGGTITQEAAMALRFLEVSMSPKYGATKECRRMTAIQSPCKASGIY